jgi:uncharacterized membrane protein YedE/YeeE
MVGAILVHAPFALRARQGRTKPRLAEHYALPTARHLDRPLILGSALFGLGWGASGFCPGPAIVSLVSGAPSTLIFVGSMVLGMWIQHLTSTRARAPRPRSAPTG